MLSDALQGSARRGATTQTAFWRHRSHGLGTTEPNSVVYPETQLGGAVYPFLTAAAGIDRSWRLVTQPVGRMVAVAPAHTFGQETPMLRWVNGDQVIDLYVDGMDTDQFLAATGLQLSLHKGGFVLSKRLSRLMRPYFVSGFLDATDVRVAYLNQTKEEAKVWDGAGLISRQMLRKLTLSDDLSPSRRVKLQREMTHAARVEFTVMTENGQDKGHAMVVDDLRDDDGNPIDFLLPRDAKTEVKLAGRQRFVGINFVHGHDDMRLDVQSLINLHPFFDGQQLQQRLAEEGELFIQALNGDVAAAMRRLDRHTTLEELESWPLREYLAAGGDPRWFASHTKSLINRHLQRLNHQTLRKLRLPIPGARHYVMPAAVAQRAGLDAAVPQGQIHIDAARGTTWVNDDDWLALPDSPQDAGIAGILGGADHDDALVRRVAYEMIAVQRLFVGYKTNKDNQPTWRGNPKGKIACWQSIYPRSR